METQKIKIMQLSKINREIILVQAHEIINSFASSMCEDFTKSNTGVFACSFSEEEEKLIERLREERHFESFFKKILISYAEDVFFSFFSIIDGVADPDPKFGNWTEVLLVNMPEKFNKHYEFLHDHFDEAYDIWKQYKDM